MLLYFVVAISFCFATTSSINAPFFHATGVLIHPRIVLTTAHGLQKKQKYLFDGRYRGKAIIHQNYKQENLYCDIALLLLNKPVTDLPLTAISHSKSKEDLFLSNDNLTFGDSGTPFLIDDEIIAIAVAILGENKNNYEVVYLSIYPHLNWIQKVIMLQTKEEELLFPWIEKQIAKKLEKDQIEKHDLINLGIGDTCDPLPNFVGDAIKKAIEKMEEVHIGYGAEQGNRKLREKIANNIYLNQKISADEVFVTEGIANSLGMLTSLFKTGAKIGLLSPTYPVYKTLLELEGMEVVEIEADQNFTFVPPVEKLDALILCSPNNPTGIAFSQKELTAFVDYANNSDTLILFDGAYESFIFDGAPRSIYEIEGAKTCAIEMRSFSKTLGFSGLRLGYFIAPKELKEHVRCKKIITAKSNGVSYPIQQGGMAALSKEGLEVARGYCKKYMTQTSKLKNHLLAHGQEVVGGLHAPYLFWKVPRPSKEMFTTLLEEHQTITIPGVGFNKEGYLRLSGFISDETLLRACKALQF
ncbi:aminotransferase class I/II-fold pyridoxal phosphate-dependent enzyme [bacterium]|nr:aminotransferase class I/II-fold pyridoxal phosphate-dependent enzyme [bacterium]